jgi:hypothetical protein
MTPALERTIKWAVTLTQQYDIKNWMPSDTDEAPEVDNGKSYLLVNIVLTGLPQEEEPELDSGITRRAHEPPSRA